MKLWLKTALICTAVLLLIVGTCSTLLLLTARDKILSMTVESVQAEQQNLSESFTQMVDYYGKSELDPAAKRSLAIYCFRKFTAKPSALLWGSETMYSNISFDPQSLLPQSELDNQKSYTGQVTGTNVIIVGSKTNAMSEGFTIYSVRDITGVYNSVAQMIWQFAGISVAFLLIGAALVMFLMRWSTRPLKSLGSAARRITQGEYTERATVKTKDEVGELAQDFNIMASAVETHVEALKELTQRQQLFIGGLTHEFKTPLTSVIGHAETLLYTKMPEDVVANSLTHIYEQCKWLERLTQKLLKLITLHEEIQLKEESVEALLDAVKGSTAETLQNRGITLEIECTIPTLPMDFDLMLSLLVNLVDNASKASKPGQTVKVLAHDRMIEVRDQGMGIPEAEITRITEPFYRVDKSRSKKMGGSGLGLALVKRIADAHSAQMVIESVPKVGTIIKVIFPR